MPHLNLINTKNHIEATDFAFDGRVTGYHLPAIQKRIQELEHSLSKTRSPIKKLLLSQKFQKAVIQQQKILTVLAQAPDPVLDANIQNKKAHFDRSSLLQDLEKGRNANLTVNGHSIQNAQDLETLEKKLDALNLGDDKRNLFLNLCHQGGHAIGTMFARERFLLPLVRADSEAIFQLKAENHKHIAQANNKELTIESIVRYSLLKGEKGEEQLFSVEVKTKYDLKEEMITIEHAIESKTSQIARQILSQIA